MKVILISGKAGHGKDTLALMLQERLEAKREKVLRPHFADLVKYYAAQYLNWDGNKDAAGRQILQDVGNNSFRQMDPDYWARITAECVRVMGDYFGFTYAIIADNRYPNEIDIVKEYNANVTTIRVERWKNDDRWVNPAMTEEQLQNEGEVALDNYIFDYSVVNRCLAELKESADLLVEELTNN